MTTHTTPSGLIFQVITAAKSKERKPEVGQKVVVHYTGWLEEKGQKGKKFDSSLDKNKPFTFIVGKGQVIKGWDETLLDMQLGEKRQVTIPASLAYGSQRVGNLIPANATLIFDIELLECH